VDGYTEPYHYRSRVCQSQILSSFNLRIRCSVWGIRWRNCYRILSCGGPWQGRPTPQPISWCDYGEWCTFRVCSLEFPKASADELLLASRDGVPIPSYFEDSYQKLASLAGCGLALSDRTSLQCLRGISADVLTNVSIAIVQPGLTFPFNRVQDGYFHDALASEQVREGRLATVPLLIGGLVLSRDGLCTLINYP